MVEVGVHDVDGGFVKGYVWEVMVMCASDILGCLLAELELAVVIQYDVPELLCDDVIPSSANS